MGAFLTLLIDLSFPTLGNLIKKFYNLSNPHPLLALIGALCCTIDVIFHIIIAKFFKIWWTVAGYDELCVSFSPIKNREIS